MIIYAYVFDHYCMYYLNLKIVTADMYCIHNSVLQCNLAFGLIIAYYNLHVFWKN